MEISYKLENDLISLRIKSDQAKLGTFHRIVSVLYFLGLDIIHGEIHTIQDESRQSIDDLFVIKKSKDIGLPELQKNLALLLDSALSFKESLSEWSNRYSIEDPEIKTFFEDKPEFIFIDDPETKTTCFYMEAFPKKGLLFHISRVFLEKQVDIVKAKIETDTLSNRAKDSFYLLNKEGSQFAKSKLANELLESILHYKGQKTYSSWT